MASFPARVCSLFFPLFPSHKFRLALPRYPSPPCFPLSRARGFSLSPFDLSRAVSDYPQGARGRVHPWWQERQGGDARGEREYSWLGLDFDYFLACFSSTMPLTAVLFLVFFLLRYALRRGRADWVRIVAYNPMSCPIYVSWRGLDASGRVPGHHPLRLAQRPP